MAKINTMQRRPKFYTPTKKKALLLLAILLVAAGILFALEKQDVIDFYNKSPDTPQDEKTTSTTDTAQEYFNDGEEREPGNSLNENEGSGGITDDNGSIDNTIDTTNPIVSSTGEIGVYTPKKDTVISSGYKIAGTSTLSAVSYRLIDGISGVIAMGELSVVDGKFAGSINYTTNAKDGRLDIFGAKEDGTEYSNVEVPIRFN